MTGRIQNKTIKKREEKKWVNEREIKKKLRCVGGCQAILHFLRRRAWRKRLCAPCPPPPSRLTKLITQPRSAFMRVF